jgi:tetratricopeptide (TPR) repeat protein
MSKFAPWKARRFRTIAGGILIVAAIVGITWSPLHAYALHQATKYAGIAAHEPDTQKALGEYQIAHALDPDNSTYRMQLATLYIAQSEPEKAIVVLGGSSSERLRKAALLSQQTRYSEALEVLQPLTTSMAAIERSQLYLEEGSGGEAIAAVVHPSTDGERVQLGLAYMVSGEPQAVDTLAATSDTPTQSVLLSMKAGGLALAQELYSRQLYHSTQRILAELADSPTKYLLLAHTLIAEAPTSHIQIQAAQTAAQQGIKLDPASLPLHEMLESIDSQLGDRAGAVQEQQLINQLQSGAI